MAIQRHVWEDGEMICAAKLNVYNTAVDQLELAMSRLDALERPKPEPPSGAAAIVAAGLVVAGSASRVSRRGLLGLSWLRRGR